LFSQPRLNFVSAERLPLLQSSGVMSKLRLSFYRQAFLAAAVLALIAVFSFGGARPAAAGGLFGGGETRSLKIYFVHTNEREEVVFKKNGRYVPAGLRRLDYLTRDWRRNLAAHMDPRLFDLVWQIYQISGSHDYIHVVSGYRSPQTNAMLRMASPHSGVAEHSRHMQGKAMDFYLPDVNIAYLRAIALKLQGGGIGYYPTSNSPFVHVDVGSVRHWPRMSHRALAALFPDGRSLHVPSDGRPLPGYALAAAAYRSFNNGPLPYFSAQALFKGQSRRNVILAAADGRLPHLLGSRALDTRGLNGSGWPAAPAEPSAPIQDSPLLAAAPDLIPDFSRGVPLPLPAPHQESAEAAEDEADVAAAPVPQFKRDILAEESAGKAAGGSGGQHGHDDMSGLLAYAPIPGASGGAVRAMSALSAVTAPPVPSVKPAEPGAAVISAANNLPLPAPKPQLAAAGKGNDAISALIARAAIAPKPQITQRLRHHR